jgi:hypothetical protein
LAANYSQNHLSFSFSLLNLPEKKAPMQTTSNATSAKFHIPIGDLSSILGSKFLLFSFISTTPNEASDTNPLKQFAIQPHSPT